MMMNTLQNPSFFHGCRWANWSNLKQLLFKFQPLRVEWKILKSKVMLLILFQRSGLPLPPYLVTHLFILILFEMARSRCASGRVLPEPKLHQTAKKLILRAFETSLKPDEWVLLFSKPTRPEPTKTGTYTLTCPNPAINIDI